MRLTSSSFAANQRIPEEFAFCAPDPKTHHWVFVDLDPGSGPIKAGEFSDGVTARGKKGPDVLAAIRGHVLGQADLTGVYALNPKVEL